MCVPADDQNPLKTIVRWLSLLAACVVGFLAPVVSAEVDPLEMPYTDVAYTGDETLRDFVARYLKDPDLWPTVLQINKVTSPADLVPGAVLQMPVAQVAAADAALAEALVAIQKATSKGARLFAPQ
eukprot:CAMPEP_0184469168 /NCGR_PEP_ID=MMETSP0740-20130409/83669_1 /TAXON_ID=385413 /ORGANISM="Thalassiosira miniscula, Strain CCMP1093" /LENGTH=125 /DNA_ID=CAMNT_0026844993 /DNA_START=151 /DNA_END=525 /DNA_ORIENTATION=-